MKKSIKTNIIAVYTLSVTSLLSINVSALDYQKTINVGFNVHDTLTVSLSSPNLIIDDLMPGTASDSNIITVNVLSNNPYGYTLTSTVGNETTYNNRNLTNTTATSSDSFSSIDYGTDVADLNSFSSNQWGYSYSDQTVTTPTWTDYSGLPLYSDTTNIAILKQSSTTSAATGDNIQFKIAAKASDTQLAGEYKNIINFILTGAPEPVKTMQTVTASDLATLMPNVGDTTTISDARDDQEYTIAKLADNKYWMVENLNLAGGTTLDTTNTDMNAGANMSTANGFLEGNKLPESSTSGFNSNTMAYVYNSGNNTATCTNTQPCSSYYSWTAATLGSGLNIATDNTDADSSICPRGWQLPNTRSGTDGTSNYRALMIAYGGYDLVPYYSSSTSPTSTIIYDNIGPDSLPNLLNAGYFNYNTFTNTEYGYYWSSTSYSNNSNAYKIALASTYVDSANYGTRNFGFPVRCVFSD